MQAVLISGSRNPQGQTARAAEAVLDGVTENDGRVHRHFLPAMQLERCRQCEDNGWGICRSQGACIIEDDFTTLVDAVAASDVVIFATPVYFSDLSESLRAFTDRLRRTCTHSTGRDRVQGKAAMGLCVAGGGGGGAPECCASLKKVLLTCGFDVVDMMPVRRQNLDAKVDRLKLAGEWLAQVPGSS